MKNKFTFPLPPTTNEAYKIAHGRMYKSDAAISWRDDVYYTSMHILPKFEKAKVRLKINLFLKHPRDIDGSLKLILDLFQYCGVYENDNQVMKLIVEKFNYKIQKFKQEFLNGFFEVEFSKL